MQLDKHTKHKTRPKLLTILLSLILTISMITDYCLLNNPVNTIYCKKQK